MAWFNMMASLVSLLGSPLMCIADPQLTMALLGSVAPVARGCRVGATSAWNSRLLTGLPDSSQGSLTPPWAPRLIAPRHLCSRLPGSQAPRLPGSQDPRLPGSEAPRLPDSWAPGFWPLASSFLYLVNQSLLQSPAFLGRELSLEKADGKGEAVLQA